VLTLTGTLDQVERSLQTLTYRAVGASDTITIDVTDYAGTTLSAAAIAVWTGAGGFTWTGAGDNTFTNPGNWTNSIVPPGTTPAPPGGSNVATFGPGNQTVSGDGAVGQFSVTGKTTLTGQVTAQGIGGTALVVDSGGALMLAGGAQFTAQQQATVGGSGLGLLIAMGGAMELSGPSTQNALVIGDQAGSNGTVLNLEQITANGLVVVGGAGTGTLELLGVAASLSDGGADIGQSAGSTGSVIVNGGEWMTAGQLTVGDAGVGTLLVNGLYRGTTGQATAFNATVGAQAGGQGAVTLDGGLLQVANVYAASSTLTVGASGDGSIVLENGSEVAVGAAQGTITANNGLLVVGGNPGGNGLIRVGSYSSLLVYGDSVVGDGGVGVVTVGAGSDSNALFATAGTLTVGTAGLVTLGGTDAVLRASVFENAGTISGSGTLSGLTGGNGTMALARIDNDGAIEASGGDLLLYGSVGGSGQLSVGDNATLTLQASVESGQVLLFGHNGRVVLNDPNAFHGTIAGFGPDDVLELASSSATSALWGSGVLTVVTPTGAFHFTLAGDYVPDSFTVQSDGLGGTNVAGGRGDVHMLTFDGLHYDFQAVGAFVAVRSTAPGTPWQVQIETAGVHGVASVTTELAVAFGDAVVTFALGRPISLHVDGAADTTLHSGALGGIPGGTLTQLAANAYQLSWSSGQSVIVSYHGDYIDWGVALAPHDGPGSVQGLLGSHSGPGTDFQLPDGTVLTHPLSNEEIVGFFADAWRVDHDASHAASHWDHHAIL
jgi:T5SS/PEP-CTERM-associated repeat protein